MENTPFGRIITAMVTPMHDDGSIDYDGLQRLAVHLADHGHDGLLVNGTTGESATTTDDEDYDCVRAVVEAVGDRVAVMAGCGTNDTEHSARAAREMVARGADALLIVTPYYNKPPQDCIVEHFRMVAEAGDGTPVMLYDIPSRTGTALSTETIRRAADIEQVKAVKDAKGDLFEASRLMAETGLLWYSGDDVVNLAHLAQGATGIVSVVGHVAGDLYAEMLACIDRGDLPRARAIHTQLIPAVDAIMHTSQGAIQVKAALKMLGLIESDQLRMPLRQGPAEHLEKLRNGLAASGLR
ncbi:4-hydroxy-tetrahydrodipicolinate synthase [Rhodococcus sp. D2-41]|uniref:4-hydroxy-tetrahydrodipicolinate synthase n=1 Tax=Speluncibacter jeojiensis TaxID=2710754 RepID=A0A9X4M1C2_9ACTN|nr:4-hydroxy-tetrahydrodipicolinate synthase [Rhodococcus sp. D2-41]MDG3011855.1 4-hydroxy-tetrahydrodipicolinate synthase [Rhodococcus sp. D2-41]MDG3013308.1 4-hydroxy-tetrahydrodipicolinate synthase [Corynebacteriales bacterium D3-21]